MEKVYKVSTDEGDKFFYIESEAIAFEEEIKLRKLIQSYINQINKIAETYEQKTGNKVNFIYNQKEKLGFEVFNVEEFLNKISSGWVNLFKVE